jgi:hypothetical protein
MDLCYRGNRVQLVENGDCSLARAHRKRRSSRDDGDGEFDRFFARVREDDRDYNMNRQRHLTPSCGGFTPTAERTVGPARTIVGELDTQTRN